MKKVQDHYFKKAQQEGYPARSVYKLVEAQQKYRLLKQGDNILDLGCMPGSWSMYAAEVAGSKGQVVGVDISKEKKTGHRGGAPVTVLCADIMTDEAVSAMQDVCSVFDVILSDMAPQTTGNKWADQQKSLTLSRRVLELSGHLLRPGGNFYCKVFEGEDFREFVSDVRRNFTMTKVFKPKSSRSESREVFVLGMGRLEKFSYL